MSIVQRLVELEEALRRKASETTGKREVAEEAVEIAMLATADSSKAHNELHGLSLGKIDLARQLEEEALNAEVCRRDEKQRADEFTKLSGSVNEVIKDQKSALVKAEQLAAEEAAQREKEAQRLAKLAELRDAGATIQAQIAELIVEEPAAEAEPIEIVEEPAAEAEPIEIVEEPAEEPVAEAEPIEIVEEPAAEATPARRLEELKKKRSFLDRLIND